MITLKKDYANTLKQSKINDIIGKLPGKGDGLTKKIENSSFTYDQAVRAYLWNKSGYEIPSISKVEKNKLIELVNENQFIFLGRMDNVINSGGIKLIPEQIEQKLVNKISQRFFITSKPDNELGEKVVLVIEGEKFELDNSIYESLDKYEKPKKVIKYYH